MKHFYAWLNYSPLYILAAVLIACLLVWLTGCGGGGTGDPSGTHDATTLPAQCGAGCSR